MGCYRVTHLGSFAVGRTEVTSGLDPEHPAL